jgi:hypothetical protein
LSTLSWASASNIEKLPQNRGESQYDLDDNIFSIEIGIDVKHTNWNLHEKHELELIRKTGIEIDSKNTNWNWNRFKKQESELELK